MKTTKKIAVILTAFMTLTMCLASCGGSKKSGALTEKTLKSLRLKSLHQKRILVLNFQRTEVMLLRNIKERESRRLFTLLLSRACL